jgi:hypothetical protein
MRTHRTIAFSAVMATLSVGTLMTWGPSPAFAGGQNPSHGPVLSLPGYRSVVIGATVVSLASLDLPGPATVPTIPTTTSTTTTTTTAPPPTTTTTTTGVPTTLAPTPLPAAGVPSSPLAGVWAELRQCESGGNYTIDTGNGYYGAYQFSAATWHGLGFTGLPNQAPPAVQDEAAVELQARSGWGQWPACSRRLGL